MITNAGTASCVPSALRFKTNISLFDKSATDIISGLTVKNYELISKPGEKRVGLIAEDVAQVDNDLVVYNNGQTWTLHFEDIIALLTKSNQELTQQIETFKKTISSSTSTSELTVKESDAGITAPGEYFDFGGRTLINAKSLSSVSGTWLLNEDGKFFSKSIKTEELMILGEKSVDGSGNILDPSIGSASIGADKNSATIYNNRVKKNSKIFITFSGDAGGSWWISERGDEWFTINILASKGYEIPFDYWIIQTDAAPPLPAPPAAKSDSPQIIIEDGAAPVSSSDEAAVETASVAASSTIAEENYQTTASSTASTTTESMAGGE
jgi:hypothetical protein